MAETGKRISKEDFEKMHDKYKASKSFVTQSVYFDAATFKRLLSVPEAVGVNVYYGIDEKGDLRPMFVPVNAEGKNIYTDSNAKGESTIEDYGNTCPPFCNDNG